MKSCYPWMGILGHNHLLQGISSPEDNKQDDLQWWNSPSPQKCCCNSHLHLPCFSHTSLELNFQSPLWIISSCQELIHCCLLTMSDIFCRLHEGFVKDSREGRSQIGSTCSMISYSCSPPSPKGDLYILKMDEMVQLPMSFLIQPHRSQLVFFKEDLPVWQLSFCAVSIYLKNLSVPLSSYS